MPALPLRRGSRVAAVDAVREEWLRRFPDELPPVVAGELFDRVVDSLHSPVELSAAVSAARALGVLRAHQGRTVAGLVEDVVALRALVSTIGGLDPGRLVETTDVLVTSAAAAFVEELTLVLESKATRDPLTGLANRIAFHDALEHEILSGSRTPPPSLMLVDLDKFKLVNDTHGHLAGDDVLVAVAGVLTRTTRTMDVVARLGGDEFAVVLPRTTAREATSAAERLLAATHEDPGLQAGEIRVTFSVGVAALPDPRGVEELVAMADRALYRVKAAGGDSVACLTERPEPGGR